MLKHCEVYESDLGERKMRDPRKQHIAAEVQNLQDFATKNSYLLGMIKMFLAVVQAWQYNHCILLLVCFWVCSLRAGCRHLLVLSSAWFKNALFPFIVLPSSSFSTGSKPVGKMTFTELRSDAHMSWEWMEVWHWFDSAFSACSLSLKLSSEGLYFLTQIFSIWLDNN